jgi:hypothetical protein
MFINKFQFILNAMKNLTVQVLYDLLSTCITEDHTCEETYSRPILRPVYAIRAVNAYESGVTDGEPLIYLHADVYTAH